jgi:hypothetical protein
MITDKDIFNNIFRGQFLSSKNKIFLLNKILQKCEKIATALLSPDYLQVIHLVFTLEEQKKLLKKLMEIMEISDTDLDIYFLKTLTTDTNRKKLLRQHKKILLHLQELGFLSNRAVEAIKELLLLPNKEELDVRAKEAIMERFP